jgi:hypothetical protein
MAIELHKIDRAYYVKFVYRAGDVADADSESDDGFMSYTFPGFRQALISFDDFKNRAAARAIVGDSVADWCALCGNTVSNVCR